MEDPPSSIRRRKGEERVCARFEGGNTASFAKTSGSSLSERDRDQAVGSRLWRKTRIENGFSQANGRRLVGLVGGCKVSSIVS